MNRSTYQTLRAQMALKGHSITTLSRSVEMKYHTLLRKMRRESEFTLPEALKIRDVLGYPGRWNTCFHLPGTAKQSVSWRKKSEHSPGL